MGIAQKHGRCSVYMGRMLVRGWEGAHVKPVISGAPCGRPRESCFWLAGCLKDSLEACETCLLLSGLHDGGRRLGAPQKTCSKLAVLSKDVCLETSRNLLFNLGCLACPWGFRTMCVPKANSFSQLSCTKGSTKFRMSEYTRYF